MTAHASNNGGKTAGGRFQRGNKFGKGRPAGSNRMTLVLDAIADGEAEAMLYDGTTAKSSMKPQLTVANGDDTNTT